MDELRPSHVSFPGWSGARARKLTAGSRQRPALQAGGEANGSRWSHACLPRSHRLAAAREMEGGSGRTRGGAGEIWPNLVFQVTEKEGVGLAEGLVLQSEDLQRLTHSCVRRITFCQLL